MPILLSEESLVCQAGIAVSQTMISLRIETDFHSGSKAINLHYWKVDLIFFESNSDFASSSVRYCLFDQMEGRDRFESEVDGISSVEGAYFSSLNYSDWRMKYWFGRHVLDD